MSAEFVLSSTLLVHEGGTKFYHGFLIGRADKGRTDDRVFVAHYGKMSALDKRPIDGGQIKVFGGDGTLTRHAKITEKTRGGYVKAPSALLERHQILGERRNEAELVSYFGAYAAEQIIASLNASVTGEPPSPAREDTPIETHTADQPAGWGAW